MPHNFIGLNNKHKSFRKGIFVDPFDEPTYLTFALDFKFEETPATNPTAEVNLENSPLFNTTSSASAIQFLTNRGYTPQANGLSTFKEILRYLTFQAPWYFQSIKGLNELFEASTDQTKGFKTKGLDLEIQTLEAVDLRMFELASLYRNAVFDNKFRRERVPDNLRWFSVDIYVAEFRNLRFRVPGIGQDIARVTGIDTGALGNVVGGGNIVSNNLNQFGYVKFTCRQCEFDFSQSLPTPTTIDIGSDGRKAEGNKFKIKVGWISEEAKFADGTRIYDDYIKTHIKNPWGARNIGGTVQGIGSFLSGLPIIGEPIQEAGQKFMHGLSQIGGLINPALQAASEFVNPPVELGDAYNIGYASNGDTVPKRKNPPSGNVY